MTVKIGTFAANTYFRIALLERFCKVLKYFTVLYCTLHCIDARMHGPGLGTSAILMSVWDSPTRQAYLNHEFLYE